MHYRASNLSEGHAGKVRGGDRLPWVAAEGSSDEWGDNFSLLTSLDWQVHVYGEVNSVIKDLCRRRRLALHLFPWRPTMERAGLKRDAVYLVRPDGYVGLADLDANPARLETYLDSRRVRPLQA